MSDLLLEVESVADMDLDRAVAVGAAFDADPELRPLRVGGDPARIRVDGSLADLICETGLPINWLTVRANSRLGFEGGEVRLYAGRGGFTGMQLPDKSWSFRLVPHHVNSGFLRSWLDAEEGRLDRVAALFERLCAAMNACYGIATVLPRQRGMPPVDDGLGDVGWLNFFGPAYLERWPELSRIAGARITKPGGVIVRTAATPWDLDDGAKRGVIDVVGEGAFRRERGEPEPGVRVPSFEDHFRFSIGSGEMPWVSWLRDRDSATHQRQRTRRYERARARRLAAMPEPAIEPPRAGPAEWSSNFDSEDWLSFGRRAFKRLGGDLVGAVAKPLLEEIATAPVELEDSAVLNTSLGPVEIRWFMDDEDAVDVYFLGSEEISALVEDVFEAWSEG